MRDKVLRAGFREHLFSCRNGQNANAPCCTDSGGSLPATELERCDFCGLPADHQHPPELKQALENKNLRVNERGQFEVDGKPMPMVLDSGGWRGAVVKGNLFGFTSKGVEDLLAAQTGEPRRRVSCSKCGRPMARVCGAGGVLLALCPRPRIDSHPQLASKRCLGLCSSPTRI